MVKSRGKGKAFGAKINKVASNNKLPPKENPFDQIFAKKFKGDNTRNLGGKEKGHARKNFGDSRRGIGVEFRGKGRVNKLVDRRFAQRDPKLTGEQKAEKRFVLQQKKLFTAKSKYNLSDSNNTEVKSVRFDLPVNKEFRAEEDDELNHELATDLVTLANFGGGSFSSAGPETMSFKGKDRNQIMAEIISQSKNAKSLRQQQKDEQLDHLHELDEKFVALKQQGILPLEKVPAESSKTTNFSSYDELYRELQVDPGKRTESAKSFEKPKFSAEIFGGLLAEWTNLSKDLTETNFKQMNINLPKIHRHLKMDPDAGAKMIRELILAKRDATKSKSRELAFIDVAFVKLISALFPVGARYHPVCTPALALILRRISAARVKNLTDCAKLIFLCQSLIEWVGEPGKYFPEVLAFLHGALMLSVQNDESERFSSMSFPISYPHRQMLFVEELIGEFNDEPISLSRIFSQPVPDQEAEESPEAEDDPQLKLQILRILFQTIRDYASRYSTSTYTAAFNAIFGPLHSLVKRLPLVNYPEELAKDGAELYSYLEQLMQKNSQVTQMKRNVSKNIKMINLLEPRFDEHFDPERPRKGLLARNERLREKRMSQKVRKETRGAMKELRKDAKYLASLQQGQAQSVRRERNEKTKRILQSLQTQESEHKKRKLKKF